MLGGIWDPGTIQIRYYRVDYLSISLGGLRPPSPPCILWGGGLRPPPQFPPPECHEGQAPQTPHTNNTGTGFKKHEFYEIVFRNK